MKKLIFLLLLLITECNSCDIKSYKKDIAYANKYTEFGYANLSSFQTLSSFEANCRAGYPFLKAGISNLISALRVYLNLSCKEQAKDNLQTILSYLKELEPEDYNKFIAEVNELNKKII